MSLVTYKCFKQVPLLRYCLFVYLFISYTKEALSQTPMNTIAATYITGIGPPDSQEVSHAMLRSLGDWPKQKTGDDGWCHWGLFKKLKDINASREFMRYCDTDAPIYDHDNFMYRIVSINIRDATFQSKKRESQIIVPGILINENHILTSYTPFRTMLINGMKRTLINMYVQYVIAKWYKLGTMNFTGYMYGNENLVCARQICAMEVDYSRYDHNPQMQFALHKPDCDIMILKMKNKLKFSDWNGFGVLGYYIVGSNPIKWIWCEKCYFYGRKRTLLAGRNEDFGETLKIVSLGMIDKDHIFNRNHLHTVEMQTSDSVLDCSGWMFMSSTEFICLQNLENHVGVGSGAFLFSKNKVFGVGAFTMIRGEMSIHVFTDIRYFHRRIDRTCTEFDDFMKG